jgi:hypothetical protein
MKQREIECLDKAIYPAPARKRHFKRIACYAMLAATVIAVPGMARAQPGFFKLDNQGDPNFNQLLGINDNQIIAGYFGAGTPPPAPHNIIQQTQAIGINNNEVPLIVGFWQDSTGLQFGFEDVKGVFTTILDPNATAGSTNQNLIGVNDSNRAAGFWVDAGGNEHGFIVNLASNPPHFTEIPPKLFNGAVATQVSGINNKSQICGFWVDGNGNDHGFFGTFGGTLTSFEVVANGLVAKTTQALGCSNNFIVGSWVGPHGLTHGFVFNGLSFKQFDAPGSSQTAAFGVKGTIINGVNDKGDFVGFFSDGTHVNGFVQFQAAVGTQ